jgi:uncharacterized Rmd1/YagE family protein
MRKEKRVIKQNKTNKLRKRVLQKQKQKQKQKETYCIDSTYHYSRLIKTKKEKEKIHRERKEQKTDGVH